MLSSMSAAISYRISTAEREFLEEIPGVCVKSTAISFVAFSCIDFFFFLGLFLQFYLFDFFNIEEITLVFFLNLCF